MDDTAALDKGEEQTKPVTRLENMDVSFVSLVTAGANRQKAFMIIKALTCPACGEAVDPDDETCPACGASMMAQGASKAAEVPAADASNEDKQSALQARARKYGIEALTVGAALSYPADAPTTTALYADPTNLKYPLGGPGNAPDRGRIRNAAARFAQNVDTYAERKSRSVIWGRIVSAELDADIAHAPNDLDELLPSDVKRRLASTREEPMGKLSASPSEPSLPVVPAVDFLAKLVAASEAIALTMAEVAFEKHAAAVAPPPAALPDPPLAPLARVETTKADPSDAIAKALVEREHELSAVRAELEKARQAQVAAEARARALKATVGASHAMPSGEIAKAIPDPKKAAPRKLWAPDMNTLR